MLSKIKTATFNGTMLDDRYLMLDIQEYTGSEIQTHPVSRNQYPGSINF